VGRRRRRRKKKKGKGKEEEEKSGFSQVVPSVSWEKKKTNIFLGKPLTILGLINIQEK
jgi:hypothetical protein